MSIILTSSTPRLMHIGVKRYMDTIDLFSVSYRVVVSETTNVGGLVWERYVADWQILRGETMACIL